MTVWVLSLKALKHLQWLTTKGCGFAKRQFTRAQGDVIKFAVFTQKSQQLLIDVLFINELIIAALLTLKEQK